MRGAAILLALVALLAGCADPRAPETLAGQRLEVGDQRLIGYAPAAIHGTAPGVVGVRCDSVGFPLRVLEPSPDPATARAELDFSDRFNRAMVENIYYTAAECEPFGPGDGTHSGRAVAAGAEFEASPETETFEDIFGFPVP